MNIYELTKILYLSFSGDGSIDYLVDELSPHLDDELLHCYIIIGKPVETDHYTRLIGTIRSANKSFTSLYTAQADREMALQIRNGVDEMNRRSGKGTLAVISYGPSPAWMLLTMYLASNGLSIEDAISDTEVITGITMTERERETLNRYKGIFSQSLGNVSTRSFYYITPHREEALDALPAPSLRDHETIEERPQEKIKNSSMISPLEEQEVEDTPADNSGDKEGEHLPEDLEEFHTIHIPEVNDDDRIEDPGVETEEIIEDDLLYEEESDLLTQDDIDEEERNQEPSISEEEIETLEESQLPDDDDLDKEENDTKDVTLFRSLGFKLVAIISLIIVVSLTGMILVASHLFRDDSKTRYEARNLKLSEIVASNVSTEIEKNRILAVNMVISTGLEKSTAIKMEKTDIIYASLISKDGRGKLKTVKERFNIPVVAKLQLSEDQFDNLHQIHGKELNTAFLGGSVVINLAGNLDRPVMGIAMPAEGSMGNQILFFAMNTSGLNKSFDAKDKTILYMVNDKGDVIAHLDIQKVLASANLATVPIVAEMIKSESNNKQRKYTGKDGNIYFGAFQKISLGGRPGGAGVIAEIKRDDAYEAISSIQKKTFLIAGMFLTITIMIIFFFSKTITKPIIRLAHATQKIMTGDYRVKIKPASKDEIGELTQSFITMGRGLEEREKMKDAFSKFVNPEVAELAMKGNIKLGGERKDVAVFFSDIRSFTAISEKLEPEEVVEFLNQYMTRMVKCVLDTHGSVDKYIGDAIMATWGAPLSHGNDTENAVNGALMMRRELIDFNRDRGGDKNPVIKIGSGINFGPCLAGQIGSDEKLEYTVIGDTVNLASRIESLNKPFKTDILISSDAYEVVKEIFDVVPMKAIKVKGKTEPQQIYSVLGRFDDPSRPKDMRELRDLLGIDHPAEEVSDEALEGGEVKYEIIE